MSHSNTPTLDAFKAVEEKRIDAEVALRDILCKRGWTYTSSTPGCNWMFKKVVNGETILTHASTAQTIEEALCGETYNLE